MIFYPNKPTQLAEWVHPFVPSLQSHSHVSTSAALHSATRARNAEAQLASLQPMIQALRLHSIVEGIGINGTLYIYIHRIYKYPGTLLFTQNSWDSWMFIPPNMSVYIYIEVLTHPHIDSMIISQYITIITCLLVCLLAYLSLACLPTC